MAIRNIVQIGDKVLRTRAKEVTEFDTRLHTLLDDMIETMIDANGIGLAANQVNVLKRVFIASPDQGLEPEDDSTPEPAKVYEFINPKIIETSGKDLFEEGCLSIIGKKGRVERPKNLTIVYQDRYGKEYTLKATDLLARVIFHENDHLDGVLFVDKVIDEDKAQLNLN